METGHVSLYGIAVLSLINTNSQWFVLGGAELSPLPSLSELCPYSSYCTRGPYYNVSEPSEKTCCEDCSCHPDCWIIGSCCLDIQSDRLSGPLVDIQHVPFTCKNQFDLFNKNRAVKFNNIPDTDHFRFIDACYKDDRRNESCFDPDNIDDYIIVSDIDDEYVFRNRKCAACNGFMDITAWKLAVECPEILKLRLNTWADLTQYIVSSCAVLSLPPTPKTGSKSRCIRSLKDSCDKKHTEGPWPYREELEGLCSGFRQLYINGEFSPRTIYNNIYCFMCNSDLATPFYSCDRVSDEDYFRITIPMSSFHALLSVPHPGQRRQTLTKCRDNEIWDHSTDPPGCRILVCPVGHAAFQGNCKFLFEAVNGFALGCHATMQTSDDLAAVIRTSSENDEHFIRRFRDVLLHSLGFGSMNCGLCFVFVFADDDNATSTTFDVKWFMYTRGSCTMRALTEHLLARCGQGIYASLTLSGITGNLTINCTLRPFVQKLSMRQLSYEVLARCEDHIYLNDAREIFDCPRLQIPKEILVSRGISPSAAIRNLSWTPFSLSPIRHGPDNNTFLVCTSFYFHGTSSDGLTLTVYPSLIFYVVLAALK